MSQPPKMEIKVSSVHSNKTALLKIFLSFHIYLMRNVPLVYVTFSWMNASLPPNKMSIYGGLILKRTVHSSLPTSHTHPGWSEESRDFSRIPTIGLSVCRRISEPLGHWHNLFYPRKVQMTLIHHISFIITRKRIAICIKIHQDPWYIIAHQHDCLTCFILS